MKDTADCVHFGGKAAEMDAINTLLKYTSYASAPQKQPFISVVLAAKPPEQPEKTVTSLLPQAKKATAA